MNATPNDFSLHALEARFEMQRFYENEVIVADGGGGGDYGYYGNSWDNLGSGNGYVGEYQVANDNSGAMFDDGSYTDGSTGAFPSYSDPNTCWPTYPCGPPSNVPSGPPSRCTICRC